MKIISWNLKYDNEDQHSDLLLLLSRYKPDISCLQEVSQDNLNLLKKNKQYTLHSCLDIKVEKKYKSVAYLVILISSELKVNKHYKIPVHHLTRRSLFDRYRKLLEAIEYQFVDLESVKSGQKWRVFNLHLEVGAGPKIRLSQFKEVLRHLDKKSANLICGDFNIFARWYLSWILGWAYGFHLREYFLNERRAFEKIFSKNGFINPFLNKITYPSFRLQLDHILIPKNIKFRRAQVLPDSLGSDHKPIMLEIK